MPDIPMLQYGGEFLVFPTSFHYPMPECQATKSGRLKRLLWVSDLSGWCVWFTRTMRFTAFSASCGPIESKPFLHPNVKMAA